MNEQTKKQVLKALAYDTNKNTIKSVMGVTDDEINSITANEIAKEKAYYAEMGYING